MNQVVEQNNTQETYEDEINLKDLFHNVWRTRVTWVIALMVVSMVFWGVWGFKSLALPNVKTYSLAANLTFENIDKGLYPNQTPFLRSDIVTSSVLKEVYEMSQLGEYGLLQSEFFQMINISPYAPDLEAIEAKYAIKLANSKKMTPQDIDLIQSQKNKEVLAAGQRGVLIRLTELSANQLPKNIIEKVLLDIYKIWADKAINERNVLKTDIGLSGSISADSSLVNELDYSIALDYVKEKSKLVKRTFALVLALPNSKTIKDPDTGLLLEDMSRAIDDRLEYQLKLIEGPIVQLGITRNPELTKIYYSEELYALTERVNMLDLKAKAVEKVLNQYMGVQEGSKVIDASVATTSSMVSPQFSGDFLDKIISLSGEATDALYRQKLSEELLQYKQEKTDVVTKIRKLERKIKALSFVADADADADNSIVVREQTIKLLNKRIPNLLQTLSNYLAAAKRIYELLDKDALSGNGALYQLAENGMKTTGGYFSSIKRWFIAYIIILFLTTVVVVPWKMIKNAK